MDGYWLHRVSLPRINVPDSEVIERLSDIESLQYQGEIIASDLDILNAWVIALQSAGWVIISLNPVIQSQQINNNRAKWRALRSRWLQP